MKKILISMFVVTIISCNHNASEKEKKAGTSNDFRSTDNKDILGSWVMCATSGNSMMEQFNVCPTISFMDNGKGSVSNSSALSENFGWSFKKGVLTILYDSVNILTKTFTEKNYYAIIQKGDCTIDLIIREQKQDNAFYLSRHLNISNH